MTTTASRSLTLLQSVLRDAWECPRYALFLLMVGFAGAVASFALGSLVFMLVSSGQWLPLAALVAYSAAAAYWVLRR